LICAFFLCAYLFVWVSVCLFQWLVCLLGILILLFLFLIQLTSLIMKWVGRLIEWEKGRGEVPFCYYVCLFASVFFCLFVYLSVVASVLVLLACVILGYSSTRFPFNWLDCLWYESEELVEREEGRSKSSLLCKLWICNVNM